MSSVYYEQLALDWSPENKDNRQFNLIVFVVVFVCVGAKNNIDTICDGEAHGINEAGL